ncbi:MAG: hypothetical protein ACXABI_00390 [Candidatus Hodarchaeales archaeon]
MLESLLIDQGIFNAQEKYDLLCMPDYLFFRTHIHKLYREFHSFPRYSVIARKYTDEMNSELEESILSLKSLFICDGATAQNTAQFFFPVAEKFNLSVVGTNLDFTELPKLRFHPYTITNFEPFCQYSLVTDGRITKHTSHCHDIDSCTNFLPISSNMHLEKGNTIDVNQKIAIGAVKDHSTFFPTEFDIMRLNLGDFIEYRQKFTPDWPDMDSDPLELKNLIIQEMEKVIQSFNVKFVFISLYKIARYFQLIGNFKSEVRGSIQELGQSLGFSESILINNTTRRVWEEENIINLPKFYDSYGYLLLFHPK